MRKYAIGIDIGGTNTCIGLIDEFGDCVAETSFKTAPFAKADDFLVKVADETQAIINDNAIEILGVGVGAPNANYYSGLIEFAPNLPWDGIIKIREFLSQKLDRKVIITNDANAAAIGERIYGGAKGLNDFLMITLGTGVGSGFVVNGALAYGHDGFAGELGHTIIDPDGRKCACGRCGCLETYCSATGVVRTIKSFLSESNEESILRNIDLNKIEAKDLSLAAKQGDKLSIEIFDYTARLLGLSIANAVAISSPSHVFLFGGLSSAGELLLTPLKKWTEHYMLNIFKNKVKIELSQLPNNKAALLGAAALIFDDCK
jgi:glucokinase